MMREVAVVGGGGHAKVIIATLQQLGWRVAGVYDDDARRWGRQILGVTIVGGLDKLDGAGLPAILAIGDNATRKRLADRMHLDWSSVVDLRAVVHSSVDVGPGTVVLAGAIIQPDARIGANAIVNTGASIDHDSTVGDFAHVAPGVRLAGNVSVGEGVLVGIGACAIPGVRIGDWAVVGAGSAVVRDVEPHATVAGVPARPVRGREAR